MNRRASPSRPSGPPALRHHDPVEPPRFLPLYQQIRQALLDALQAGTWGPGGLIPSEQELAARFGVSQGTVRKAIEVLVADGILLRRQGRGTYVVSHAESQVQFRFLRLRPDHGPAERPQSRILQFRRQKAPADVQRLLSRPAADTVLFIRRLLSFDGQPVVLDDIWLAGDEFRQLTREQLAQRADRLYSVFESELGTKMLNAREKIRAVSAPADIAALLGTQPGKPLLLVERITSTFNKRAVELRRGLYLTDHHHYANEL
ncbi:MAG: GntR family transcriptional regulator [Lautropia sp.]|nr:GntR family transcriptional regulator [Lautropia sp.]